METAFAPEVAQQHGDVRLLEVIGPYSSVAVVQGAQVASHLVLSIASGFCCNVPSLRLAPL